MAQFTIRPAEQQDVIDATKVNLSDIKDNLTSLDGSKPLSANQGKILKGLIDNINSLLTSDDTTLYEIQEIVDFIQQNKDDLNTLGISNIAGLQTALDNKVDDSQVLTNVPANAKFTDTVYSHPATHPATMITTTDEFTYSNSTTVQDVLDDLDQAIANVNAKDPVVTLTGAVTGSGTMTNLGNVSITTTATSDPTLTLTGDVTGSATFTDLGNATLTTVVGNNSHTHDQTTVSNSADSDKLNGAVDSENATGSTIVKRNSSGYIYGTAFNSTLADTATAATHYYTETSSDGWLRPKTLANVKTEIVTSAAIISGLGYTPLSTTSKAADSDKLDNLDSTQFLRSDTSDTMTGTLNLSRIGSMGTEIYIGAGEALGSMTGTAEAVYIAGESGVIIQSSTDNLSSGLNNTATICDTNGNSTFPGNITLTGQMYTPGNIYHTEDSDTYHGFHAANQWRVVTGGTEMLEVNDTNVIVQSDLTVNGGDIILGGTGRIQGIDTVSASTDAASKEYVDANTGETTWVANDSRAKTALNASGTAPIYACRAWVNFNGTFAGDMTLKNGGIRACGNVSSITDNGTAKYTINFITAMPDENYVINGTAVKDAGVYAYWVAPTSSMSTTSCQVKTALDYNTFADCGIVSISIFR